MRIFFIKHIIKNWFEQRIKKLNWTEHQLKIINDSINIINEKTEYDKVVTIWQPLLSMALNV